MNERHAPTSSIPSSIANEPLRRTSRAALGLAIAVALLLPACATRMIEEQTVDGDRIKVSLRTHKRWFGATVERDFQHPINISKQRVLHILSAIDVERKSEESGLRERVPTVHADILEELTAGLTQGLNKAGPDQEVAILSVRKERRLGLFHRKFLTSLVAFVRDDHLHLSFSRVDWRIPREREHKLPLPRLGQRQMDFRLAPGRGMHTAGAQTVVVPWRNDLYAQPVRPAEYSGKGAKRTILFDSPLPASSGASTQTESLPADLSPEALRELADLAERRREGSITESEYQQRRARLLGETR